MVVSGLLWFFYSEYQQKAQDYSELDEKHQIQLIAINEQQKRIQHLAELETKHTQELDNAKSEIDTLRADVAAGRRKLRVQAICPVSETTPSSSLDDATAARLTESAIGNYWTLRERIVVANQQVLGLQEYITTQCLIN
ncbi:lysis protein [Xenorhabdus bovienii]|uniref:lysis protein n=1 Tax=Xenorhabdus bovienii TaxID=40576 RepID=UPI0023B31DA5|nr:lysis protein [Xenorhabdus bovienii]